MARPAPRPVKYPAAKTTAVYAAMRKSPIPIVIEGLKRDAERSSDRFGVMGTRHVVPGDHVRNRRCAQSAPLHEISLKPASRGDEDPGAFAQIHRASMLLARGKNRI